MGATEESEVRQRLQQLVHNHHVPGLMEAEEA